jgi:hypothetical protein
MVNKINKEERSKLVYDRAKECEYVLTKPFFQVKKKEEEYDKN